MAITDKLTAIANHIRILWGTNERFNMEEMAQNIDAANSEINTQSELIAQIISVLESKE